MGHLRRSGDFDKWHRLRDVMWFHCAQLGRDPSDVACSSYLRVDPDPDPAAVASRAGRMFEHGVDVVALAPTGAHDTGTVELLADVLADV